MNESTISVCLNQDCKSAIQEMLTVNLWLKKHKELYLKCILKPNNLPSIPLCYHQGQYFVEIADFVELYERRASPELFYTDEDYMNIGND